MAPPPCRAALTLAFVVLAALLLVAAAASPYHELDPAMWATDQASVMPVSACTVEDQEAGCEGDAPTRRQLGGNSYIGYDALRRNAVPCSYRGASYYNCRPGAQANPYSRGCSSITRCRG
uniref:Uncharacterized protein n=1 Tax=Avena sativa TaxID=4498 RepID=A0ACD5WJL7_AVESA